MPWFSRATQPPSTSTTPPQSGGGGGVFDSIGQGLVDPLMQATAPVRNVVKNVGNVGMPIGMGLIDAVGNIKKTGESFHKAAKDWSGKEKFYDYDDQTGLVTSGKRGRETENANGFQQEIARDNLEKGVHASIKTVTGLGKGAHKSMGGVGKAFKLAKPVTDSINPRGGARPRTGGGVNGAVRSSPTR